MNQRTRGLKQDFLHNITPANPTHVEPKSYVIQEVTATGETIKPSNDGTNTPRTDFKTYRAPLSKTDAQKLHLDNTALQHTHLHNPQQIVNHKCNTDQKTST
jgi:hypothetical protein